MVTTAFGQARPFKRMWEESGVEYETPIEVHVFGWSDSDDSEALGPLIGRATLLGEIDEGDGESMVVMDLVDVGGNRNQTIGLFFEFVPVGEETGVPHNHPTIAYDEYMALPIGVAPTE